MEDKENFGSIKIDKDVPLIGKYPFENMQVGDSFLLPETIKRTSVAVAAMRYGRNNNKKFTVRKTKDGFRCWRTE
jgi:hypothetical protein